MYIENAKGESFGLWVGVETYILFILFLFTAFIHLRMLTQSLFLSHPFLRERIHLFDVSFVPPLYKREEKKIWESKIVKWLCSRSGLKLFKTFGPFSLFIKEYSFFNYFFALLWNLKKKKLEIKLQNKRRIDLVFVTFNLANWFWNLSILEYFNFKLQTNPFFRSSFPVLITKE